MRLVFTPQGWEDYAYWQRVEQGVVERIDRLLDDALRSPTSGIGKPEFLKYGVTGAWSRRVTEEHRLVYMLAEGNVVILQARYHYDKA